MRLIINFCLLGLLINNCGLNSSKHKTVSSFDLRSESIVNFFSQEFKDSLDPLIHRKIKNLRQSKELKDKKYFDFYHLELNKELEKKIALKNSQDHSILNEIEQKYKSLNEIVFQINHKKRSYIRNKKIHNDFEKKIYSTLDTKVIYHPLVLKEVAKVYNDFGSLYINETRNTEGKIVSDQVQAKNKPWSGFWYPFTNKDLYKDENSPLGKFDRLTEKFGTNEKSRAYEVKIHKGFTPASWEGLCDAWSLASVLTPEPKEGKEIEGIYFSISDLKALSTFSHLKYPYTQYGISYKGNAKTDGTYQDIKPEAFHQIITTVLGKEERAVVIDDMAGIQVWNKPLYRFRWKVEKDPDCDYAFIVKSYPWLIKERSSESDILTNTHDTIAPFYTYRLYVDKKSMKDGKYLVVASQWIKESYEDHPDTVKVPYKNGDLGSHNKEFNKNIEIYKRYLLNSF